MSLATYADLQTTIAGHLNRSDLSSAITDFITLAEARFRRDLKDWLRFTVSMTNLTGDTALAATVSEVLGVAHNDGGNGTNNLPLRIVTYEEYHRFMERDATAGTPECVYVDFDADTPLTTLRFWPPIASGSPLATLSVEAVKVLPALSDSQTTNALLREAPDVYLYGALAESAPFLMHDERLPMWEARASAGIRALRVQTERRVYGAQPHPRPQVVVF